MMNELVRKQDVIDAVHYYIESGYKCNIFQELKNLPSVEPERTAKAITEDRISICDNCSGLLYGYMSYCPRCGAKLDWSGNE